MAGLIACVTLVATTWGQQFREPTLPANQSAFNSFQSVPSYESQLHADAIRRQMLRAQREQGAPNGFAEQAYRAQQIYAAQQAYEAQLALARNSQNHRVAQAAGYDAIQPDNSRNRTANSPTGMPPVHLTPQQGLSVALPAPAYSQPVYNRPSNSRPQPVSTSLNDRSMGQSQAPQTLQVPEPKFAKSMNPNRRQPPRLQERISSALSGKGRRTAPINNRRQVTVSSAKPANQVAQTYAGQSPHPSQTSKSKSAQRAQETPSSAHSGHRHSPVAARKRQPQPARANTLPPTNQSVKVAVGVENDSESRPQVKQTVMQQYIDDYVDEPVELPMIEEEPMAYVAQDERNGLRSGGPRARQISILNRSSAQDSNSFDAPAEPEFMQEESRPTTDTGNDLQLTRPMGVQEGDDQGFENSLRGQDDDRPKSLLDDINIEDDEEMQESLLDRSCEAFRRDLLDNPIRNIALDISPPASELIDPEEAVSRQWTDRVGNVVATGRMVDLRRGYVVIESENGPIRLAVARLSDSDWDAIADYWQIPVTCGVGYRGSVDRCWIPQTFTWTAPSLCHKTLYFENIQLERYGHSHGPFSQPIHSVGHFFVSLISLPYQSAIHPPNECNYALGFYRPGDCAPWLKDPIPISLRGAARQAAVIVGLGYAL